MVNHWPDCLFEEGLYNNAKMFDTNFMCFLRSSSGVNKIYFESRC